MTVDLPVPETRVLAVASHVVSGNVGNKIAVFVMQSLGCEVAALNTVQFSNHTGYKQWKGTRVSAQEITDLWEGLKNSYLDDFDMMLSGYIPGAPAVEAVGQIAEELRSRSRGRPGSFFWVLDPVMGDNGNLYVAPECVPAYRKLLDHADLILPNQFEAELLSGVKIDSHDTLAEAVQVMHERYGVPHIVITSVSMPHPDHPEASLSVVGSTMTSTRRARPFKIVFPAIDVYFSGTGDMFAALMVVRMREAAHRTPGLLERASWVSPDDVVPTDLPLARAAEKVLGSMHDVLDKTAEAMNAELRKEIAATAAVAVATTSPATISNDTGTNGAEATAAAVDEKTRHLLKSKAAELRLVRNLDLLKRPTTEFRAVKI